MFIIKIFVEIIFWQFLGKFSIDLWIFWTSLQNHEEEKREPKNFLVSLLNSVKLMIWKNLGILRWKYSYFSNEFAIWKNFFQIFWCLSFFHWKKECSWICRNFLDSLFSLEVTSQNFIECTFPKFSSWFSLFALLSLTLNPIFMVANWCKSLYTA